MYCDELKKDDVNDEDTATSSSSGENSGGDDVAFSVIHGITTDFVPTGLSVL